MEKARYKFHINKILNKTLSFGAPRFTQLYILCSTEAASFLLLSCLGLVPEAFLWAGIVNDRRAKERVAGFCIEAEHGTPGACPEIGPNYWVTSLCD
jgi:hypothetical protein